MRKGQVTCFPTFHPAAGMRFPSIRRKMEEDFKKLEKLVSSALALNT